MPALHPLSNLKSRLIERNSRRTKGVKSGGYFEHPENYLRGRAGILLRIDILRRILPTVENGSILDVGCGDGAISLALLSKSNELTLIDSSHSMISLAEENTPENLRGRVNYVCGDFLTHDFASTYDIVLCIGVMAHVQSIPAAISKLAKITKPNGKCIIQYTDSASWIGRIKFLTSRLFRGRRNKYGYRLGKISTESFIDLTNRGGFRHFESVRYFGLLPGMGWLPIPVAHMVLRSLFDRPGMARFGTDVIAVLTRGP